MPLTLEHSPPVTTERLTRAQAADRLGVSTATIDRYALSGLLTRYKNRLTGRVSYDAAEIEKLRTEREEQ